MPAADGQVVALVERQSAARERINTAVIAFVVLLIRSLRGGGFYDDAKVADVARRVAAQVRSGQVATGNLTSAYIDQTLKLLGVVPPRGPVRLPALLRPVDPVEQWTRPAKVYRAARAQGSDELQALEQAVLRASVMVGDDTGLAMRAASRARLTAVESVTGYRRVIHPELARGGSCGLCIAASDRVYQKADLLPLHTRCGCEVLPIIGELDPGHSLNGLTLADLYGDAGGTDRAALKRTRYVVHQHGELGSVLRKAGDEFTSESDLKIRRRNAA